MLAEASRGRFADPFVASLCAAYVILHARKKDLVDVEDLNAFLKTCDIPEHIGSLVRMIIGKAWDVYRPLITSCDVESLMAFMVSDGFETRRYAISTPLVIQRLAFKLLGLSNKDTFVDYGCDTGNVLITSLREFGVKFSCGYEIAQEAATIAEMRLDSIGRISESRIVRQNVFAADFREPKFTKFYCCPPFGMKFMDEFIREYMASKPALPELRPSCSATWVFALRALDSLDANGKGAMIVNDGALFNQVELPCRKYLLERNLIEAVISLPSPTFSTTGVSASLVIFNPAKSDSSVLMVDASLMGDRGKGSVELSEHDIDAIVGTVREGGLNSSLPSSRIRREELECEEYILHPRRYIKPSVAAHSFSKVKPLKDFVVSIRRGSSLTSKELLGLTVSESTPFHYITQANIKDGIIEEGIPSLKTMPPAKSAYCAKDGDVILTKAGRPIKCAVVCIDSGEQILVSGNQYIITLDTKRMNPFFLKTFFDSEVGQASLSQISVGAAMPAIALRDLNEVKIPIVPMAMQNKIAETYKARQDSVASLRRKLNRSLSELNGVFDELIKEVGDVS